MTISPPARTPSGDRPGGTRSSTVTAMAACAVVGFVVPNAMVVLFGVGSGFAPATYFGLWVASIPATQLTLDLVLVAVTFVVWSRHDAQRTGTRWWPVIPATLLVGICFAVPLYLWERERRAGEARRTVG